MKKSAEFYDRADIFEDFNWNEAEFQKAKTKRVNILVPDHIVKQAVVLGEFSGTGYQNTLKMAMVLGLKQLLDSLDNCKQSQH